MDTAKLLVVSAEARELSGLLRLCAKTEIPSARQESLHAGAPGCAGNPLGRAVAGREARTRVHWLRAAELNGSPAILIANGAGPERARMAVEFAVARWEVRAVVSAGYCGALDPRLGAGQVFVADAVQNGNGRIPVDTPQSPPAEIGTAASITHVARMVGEKETLRKAGARVVEMESAGVVKTALRLGIPAFCVRAVTDLSGEDLALDYDSALDSEGRFTLPRVLRELLREPVAGFPELLRLRRRCRLASENLGAFLAACRF